MPNFDFEKIDFSKISLISRSQPGYKGFPILAIVTHTRVSVGFLKLPRLKKLKHRIRSRFWMLSAFVEVGIDVF